MTTVKREPPRRGAATGWALLAIALSVGGSLVWYCCVAGGRDREAQAAPLTDREVTNSIGMKFARIPPGTFVMGSPEDELHRGADETPHTVTISRPFYLGVYEVMQSEYEKVTGKNPSFFAASGGGKQRVASANTREFPVENVSWDDAVAFCRKLGALPAEQAKGYTYRLPTEAEWEYACRADAKAATHYGAKMDATQANFNGLSPYNTTTGGPFFRRTVRVGEYKRNDFGLYDMHGNVQEWCADWYAADAYAKSPKADPPGPAEGTERVLRGGSWANSGKACRAAVRNKMAPDAASYSSGLRVALMAK